MSELFNNFLQVLNEKILEKPKDKENAYEMLKRWPVIFLRIFVSKGAHVSQN